MAKSMPQNHEIFVEYLNDVFGQEDKIAKHPAADGGMPVCVFVYRNLPRPGMITGVTYGLSVYPFPAWKYGRPELIVSMKSLDPAWPFAAAYFAAEFRGEKRFSYGDVFTMDGPIAEDTKMNGFIVFAQGILEAKPPHLRMNDFDLSFSQLYPIYSSELPLYAEIGLEGFWKHPRFEIDNPARPPMNA